VAGFPRTGLQSYTLPMASAAPQRLDITCSSCGATIVFEAVERTARCAYCDSPQVVDRPATADRPDPVFAVGFVVDRVDARGRIRRFLEGRRWAPSSLRRAAAERVRGVYLPAYLYSATAESSYTATIGEDYWKTRIDGKKVRRLRKTEHRTLEGRHACYLADILVTASRGIPNSELEEIEPFDLQALRRYGPALVSGWASEEPSLGREECLELGRREARQAVGRILRGFMPGDSCRDLRHHTELRDESIDLALLPVWVFAMRFRDDRPPVRLLVNGQSGEVFGRTPLSWTKIVAVAGAVLGFLALLTAAAALLGWLG
jgi:hypothetical protein